MNYNDRVPAILFFDIVFYNKTVDILVILH